MRESTWLDLKRGDIFFVPNPGAIWKSFFGIHGGGRPFKITDDGYMKTYPDNGHHLVPHPEVCSSRPDGQYSKMYYTFDQPVMVMTPDEMTTEMRTSIAEHTPMRTSTGSDPEMFVVHGKEKESILPAFRFLPSKTDVDKFEDMYSFSYWDGFAAEFRVSPGGCHGYQIDHLRKGLLNLRSQAVKYDRTAKLSTKNTFEIPARMMATASDEQTLLGCDASLNAYDNYVDLPASGREATTRFAGGHIHFGLSQYAKTINPASLVKGCDIMAGIPAVAIFASFDTPERRFYYGRAGEYRLPNYGIEYRVLSNAWLCAPEAAHLILNLTRAGLKLSSILDTLNISPMLVQDIINSCNVKAARRFVEERYPMYHKLLRLEGLGEDDVVKKGFEHVVQGGIEDAIPDPTDIDHNWRLDQSWGNHSNASQNTWRNLCFRKSPPSSMPSAPPAMLG